MVKMFLLGRLILGAYYVYNAVNLLLHSSSMAGWVASNGVPAAQAAIILSGLILLVGGASLLTGLYPKIGVAALVLFLVPVTIAMHPYWNAPNPEARMSQQIEFMKNLALLGSALMFLAIPTPWACSLGRKKTEPPTAVKYDKTA